MEKRSPSPSLRATSPRPTYFRKRSNSLPIVDALGCSTPEAELILAEGRAAVRRRHPSVHQRGRRKRSAESGKPYRPQDHIHYLERRSQSDWSSFEEATRAVARSTRHARIPSNATDDSTSTMTGPAPALPLGVLPSPSSPGSVLGSYSANLASFIQTRLNSIPSYQTVLSALSPRSCPDFSSSPRTPPPASPVLAKSPRRPTDSAFVLELPSVRPPLKSAFSAWSSTDDETEEDVVPPLPSTSLEPSRPTSKTSNDTAPMLRGNGDVNDSSFLFSCTPAEDEQKRDTIQAFTVHELPASSDMSSGSHATSFEDDYASDTSAHPQLTASSAPSISSASTGSYFEYKRAKHLASDVKGRIVTVPAPHNPKAANVLTAISPFEGGSIAHVHNILVESQQRVVVEGLSFDLIRDLHLPDESMRRVPTPC